MASKGFSDLVTIILLIVVVFVVVTLLFNWVLNFAKTSLDKVTQMYVPDVSKLIEVKSINYVTPYLKIIVYPHVPINVTYVIVLKDGTVICKAVVNKVIDEPYEEIKIKCTLTRGTYIVELVDNYYKVVAKKIFTIGN